MKEKRCIAWCPECFDELREIEVKDIKGMIIGHEYYCDGCDETYELNKKLTCHK